MANQKSSGKKSGKKQEEKRQAKIPRSVQQSIPYEYACANGMFMNSPGVFSKSYKLEDANFTTADDNTQTQMFLDYEGLLNAIGDGMTAEITVVNRSIDQNIIRNRIMMKPHQDQYNKYRDIYNGILLDKMSEGRNNLKRDKYLTISTKATDVMAADAIFRQMDGEVASKVARITKQDTVPLNLYQRLNLLYDIYNPLTEFPFNRKVLPIVKTTGATEDQDVLDMKKLAGYGLTTKDLVAPASLQFNAGFFMVGDVYARAMFMDNLPTEMNANVLNDIADLPCNMLASIIYQPIPRAEAANMVKHQLTNINENIVRAQKNAVRNNYDPSILPSELSRAKAEAEALRDDMQSRNQKLFKTSVIVVLFAKTREELEQYTTSLKSVGVTHLAQMKPLSYQQEAGFHSALPLADKDVKIDRVLSTEASAVFMPFNVKELSQEHGIYYGLNAVSRNMILYDRTSADNYNGLIFGKPGSGKSFIAKSEMLNVLLNTDDTVIVIDPEGEYGPMASSFGGEVLNIALGSRTYINPLDMDVQFAGGDEDPITPKLDFLVSICETICHGMLSPAAVNVIHRCGRAVYAEYYAHMRELLSKKSKDENGHLITCDRNATPTLVDFYEELTRTKSAEAQELAQAIEMYCIGSYDLFAHRTTINPRARFVVYNVKDIGTGMKELALQICLNDVWNRIIENRKVGKKTWFYIDEFHLLTQNASSAQFLDRVVKRARKWGGIPTFITQNVEDMLTNDNISTILSNCSFMLMMNQSPIDRAALAELYNIPSELQDYITDKPAGTGLLYTGSTIVPFVNQFPKDNELYNIMSTKATEKDAELFKN